MVEAVIYFAGLLLWFWFVPKVMSSVPEGEVVDMEDVKFTTAMGIAWPLWFAIMVGMCILYPIEFLFNKWIKFRTK